MTRNIVIGRLQFGILEDIGSLVVLNQISQIKEAGVVTGPGSLLHIVSYDDDRVVF